MKGGSDIEKRQHDTIMPEKVITSIYVMKDTLDTIDKLANRAGITRNEQIRRFIDKGLAIDSYEDNLEIINGVIRQELSLQIKKLGNRLAGLINRLTIISAAGYYANIAIVSDLIDRDRYSSFEKIEQLARKRALAYANQKDADAIAAFLDDEEMKKAVRAVKGEQHVDFNV